MKILKVILTLLSWLADRLDQRQRRKEQADYEKQKQQAQDDPASWFNDHFNGDTERVRDKRLPEDASQTNETKPTKPDQDS